MSGRLFSLAGIRKSFPSPGGAANEVLCGIDLEMGEGESLAVMGPSGSGKSTLLNLLGALDVADGGTLLLFGQDAARLSHDERARLRNDRIGFIFQQHHLLPQCTALENTLVPRLAFQSRVDAGSEGRARRLLKRVGLSHRLDHLPGALSGGERQRVALVRALVGAPRLVLADEPTGSLDAKGADEAMAILTELTREENAGLVVVTHAPAVAARVNRRVRLVDGKLLPLP